MTTQTHWTKAVNLVKTQVTDSVNYRSKLLADIKNGESLSKWQPELCIKMLQLPSANNYLPIKKLIERANR